MKDKLSTLVRLAMVLGIFFNLTGGLTQRVQAETTCTWNGNNTNWYDVDNWSGCVDSVGNPKYPGDADDVIIPAFEVTYPVMTIYAETKPAINANSLIINTGAQITIDEQTHIYSNQFDNYGTILIEEVVGHNLRIEAPFNNYGVANFGSEASLILYHSGTHTGSFSGRQLSFIKETTAELNTFQAGSNINVSVLMVGDNRSVDIQGEISWEKMYLQPGSSANLTNAEIISPGEVIFHGGTLITNTLNIPEGETLSGVGTIQSDLVNSGVLSPGLSPGILTVDGIYTQESNGALTIEIGGSTPGTEHDQLIVTGAAALDGTLDISLIDDFNPVLGDSFTIMTFASHTGSFSTENLPTLDAGLTWQVNYNDTAIVLTLVSPGGSISGTVDYVGNQGFNPVTLGLFLDPDDPPVHTVDVASTNGAYPYTLTVIEDGTFYVGALMDLNGNDQPDPGEPFAWYDDNSNGVPDPISVSTGDAVTDIDITLKDPYFYNYLPLIIH